MYLPKRDINKILKELGCGVSQTQPTVFNELPHVNFSVTGNNPTLFLDNDIAYQTINVQIDIWANDSVSASNLLSNLEEKMRSNYYNMTYSADVPNSGDVFHIVTRFTKKY